MKILIISILAIFATLQPDWKLSFADAKIEAEQSHKVILLNFSGSDWCGPCIKLTREVFESQQFEKYASEHLVLVRADFPRQKKNQLNKEQVERNEQLAEKYNSKGVFPLTVLIDEKGKVIKSWEGYQLSPDAFLSEIQSHSVR